MKSRVRHLYPGGNTPEGFYSYYNYIIGQMEAQKIFCIKGGPGTGKSTLMKAVGKYFEEKGESVDYMWCSSDPDSLDGVLLSEKNIALIDGTAPHIVDPKNPGAVDKIVNMGECWNEDLLRKHKKEITYCGAKISESFDIAYGYLGCAGYQHMLMNQMLCRLIPEEVICDTEKRLEMEIGNVTAIKRAESKALREFAMGIATRRGKVRKFFAGAISPGGIINRLDSLVVDSGKLIVLRTPQGFNTGHMMHNISERMQKLGFDIEEFYCPMNPANKLEHIVVREAGIAMVCENIYHSVDIRNHNGKVYIAEIKYDAEENNLVAETYDKLREMSSNNIYEALNALEKAKKYHDELEQYYISAMDFEKVEMIIEKVILEIEST